ncbi:hypothetical protein CWM47_09345 [Spirosoma pollinicola]|uniref:Uncharacterized protein n=1 Tax=Spirosoma pollinicola TaxID=2057025 RepID=A0A2K8ZBM0_9BACT|nr:hypothetical protein CWM47_09345 [Spirosoma pollinicola]
MLRRGADGLHTIENGQIKVGVNTNYGGAITYLAFLDSHGGKVSTANMVNNPDLGRQIQIALYSGPIDYSDRWGWHLGWDPIQAGDTYGNSSEVVVLEEKPNLLYVKTIPKQFGIPNEPGEATIEHWIHLEGNLVKVHAKVVMLRSDKNQYEARQQEFPCAYLNGDYHNMWFYKGSEPYTNDKLSLEHIQPPSTMLFGDVYPTEPWMASTNDNGYGMGLYVKDNYEWKRGYFGSDLSGDEYSTVASYIAAANRVVLDHNLVYEWDYELIVGHLDEIRSHIYTKTPISSLINYRFDTSRRGWYYHNAQDAGLPIQGKLHVNLTNPDNNNIVAISSPYSFWKGGNNPKLYLRAAFKTKVDKFRMRWRRSEEATMLGTPDRQLDFSIINDGQFHTYEIDLSQNADWLKNNIGQVEFGAVREGPLVSGWVEIEWLSTAQNGPLDQPAVAQEPAPIPCEPGRIPISVKRVTYSRAK